MTISIQSQVSLIDLLKYIYSTPLNVHRNEMGLVLDLSYITDKIIVCSYPVTRYPKLIYRNKLEDLITFLNVSHGPCNWKIYNFKIERDKSDYGDNELMGLVNAGTIVKLDNFLNRMGWMDHSPPPFLLMQNIVDDIRNQLAKSKSSVAVLHCKMGKGRSGTICIAYLMKYLDTSLCQSRNAFMNKRFKPGVSRGVTIRSQIRWLKYHEMFLYYEPELRPEILSQLSQCKFKLHTIQLKKFSNILLSRPCSLCIKVQTYNESRDSLVELALLETNLQISSQSDTNRHEKLNIYFPVELDVSDMRLEFGISAGNSSIANRFTSLASYAHCWLNLYWESLKCSKSDSKENYLVSNLLNEQRNGQEFSFVIKWNELEGNSGTNNRGLKLFESLIIKWFVRL